MRKLLSAGIDRNTPLILSFIVVIMIFVASCTKVSPPAAANAKFLGDWFGSSRCTYSNVFGDTVLVTGQQHHLATGSDGNSLIIGVSVGYNNCYSAAYMNGSVNHYSLSVPIQYFTDNCGVAHSVGGNGTISTDYSTLSFTTIDQSGGVTTTCMFTGVKQ